MQLCNFRNISSEKIINFESFNCFLGNNAQGKSNLLEAIYYTIRHKSFRKNTTFSQIVSLDCEKVEILIKSLWDLKYYYHGRITPDYQEWILDGISNKKIPVDVFIINPFDYFSFFHDTRFRRDQLDQFFSYLDLEYKKLLSNIKLALKHRNILLKRKGPLAEIDAIDINLATYSHLLTLKRDYLIKEISPKLNKYFKSIFANYELKIELISNFRKSADEIYHLIKSNLKNDLAAGVTTIGVHRDDYAIFMNNLLASSYGSVGQLKMAFLGLIFSFIQVLKERGDEDIIILIDDISGELDANRWNLLIDSLMSGQFQIFITTANDFVFGQKLINIKNAAKFKISDGLVLEL